MHHPEIMYHPMKSNNGFYMPPSFSEFLNKHRYITGGDKNSRIEIEFSSLVKQMLLFYYYDSPQDPFPSNEKRLLIGVSPFNPYDMEFLDKLVATLASYKIWIDIFNTSNCKKQKDFEEYIPDIEQVFQTPVVGYWLDGKLQESATGAKARELVYRTCKV